MACVDLNPVRAGVADTLGESSHTSIKRRIESPPARQAKSVPAVAGPPAVGFLPISESDYMWLVDWAGRQFHRGKRGVIANDAPPAIGLRIDAAVWLTKVSSVESRYCRAVGGAQALLDKAREIGQRWLMVWPIERVPERQTQRPRW